MRALTLTLGLLLAAGSALADKVPPPPKDCVPGSLERTGHSGPYCALASCKSNAECQGGSCETRKLCIVPKTLGGGRRPRDAPPPPVVPSVVGSCERGKACPSGQCKAEKVCIPRARKGEGTPEPAPIRRAGCGCSLGATAPAEALAPLLLGLAALLLRRARPRR